MEKRIQTLIEAFAIDLDHRKIAFIDQVLFLLLFEKEKKLLSGHSKALVDKIAGIIERYHDYPALIMKMLRRRGMTEKDIFSSGAFLLPERLILLVTHNCQLRCSYCRVRKFPASMDEDTAFRGIDLLFTSIRRDIQLQFFGGEPLLRFDLIKKAVDYVGRINKDAAKKVTFILTTNGIALTPEKIDFFRKHDFIIECSMDGQLTDQLVWRKACNGKDYYSTIMNNFRKLFSSGIPHYSISVVTPQNVAHMAENFGYLSGMGFKRLQMNYSLGVMWPQGSVKTLLAQTRAIVRRYLGSSSDIEFINATPQRREPVVLNAELTLDCDGDIYSEYGICLEDDFRKMKERFLLARMDKTKNINLCASSRFQNFYRLSKAYPDMGNKFRKIILNNILLGRRYKAFLDGII